MTLGGDNLSPVVETIVPDVRRVHVAAPAATVDVDRIANGGKTESRRWGPVAGGKESRIPVELIKTDGRNKQHLRVQFQDDPPVIIEPVELCGWKCQHADPNGRDRWSSPPSPLEPSIRLQAIPRGRSRRQEHYNPGGKVRVKHVSAAFDRRREEQQELAMATAVHCAEELANEAALTGRPGDRLTQVWYWDVLRVTIFTSTVASDRKHKPCYESMPTVDRRERSHATTTSRPDAINKLEALTRRGVIVRSFGCVPSQEELQKVCATQVIQQWQSLADQRATSRAREPGVRRNTTNALSLIHI